MIKSANKNLVIAAVGDESLHRHWLSGRREYDVCLIYYGAGTGYAGEADHYRRAKGYKFHLIRDYIDENPWVSRYDYVWLPDDDVHASADDINKLFLHMRDYDLWVAQPSIMGHYGVKISLHQMGSIIRFTNWVEIMCPCFSYHALEVCKTCFKENNCGWSIETIWNVLLGHPRAKMAIIDDVVVHHTRPVRGGDVYTGIADPMKEATDVYYRWGLDKEMEKDLEHGTPADPDVYCAVVYKQFFKDEPQTGKFWPPSCLVRAAIDGARLRGDGDLVRPPVHVVVEPVGAGEVEAVRVAPEPSGSPSLVQEGKLPLA